ncbi:hypothetical protein SAMN02745223_00565 [Devosia limi DSM 17137]|uniref:DUF2474 domain-containing protein n=1 Tax=Devosia limi DSM 17137 TaxID=1121477 RepID=A0A1M4U0F1_9HYPH|nr:hypothetical protein SAMN02745223_00565 [Devosia limi DSM 17137]
MATTDEAKSGRRPFPMIAKGWKLMFLALASWAIALGVLYGLLKLFSLLTG